MATIEIDEQDIELLETLFDLALKTHGMKIKPYIDRLQIKLPKKVE